MTYINITKFVLISQLEKDHSIIERSHLKNVIFIQTILSFVLLRRVLKISSNEIFSDSHNPDMVIFNFFSVYIF